MKQLLSYVALLLLHKYLWSKLPTHQKEEEQLVARRSVRLTYNGHYVQKKDIVNRQHIWELVLAYPGHK